MGMAFWRVRHEEERKKNKKAGPLETLQKSHEMKSSAVVTTKPEPKPEPKPKAASQPAPNEEALAKLKAAETRSRPPATRKKVSSEDE